MKHQLEILPRKRLRLPIFNYRINGYYFVTICTNNRQCLFGDISDSKMHLNPAGKMIERILESIQNVYFGWFLDSHIVMPNHIHAILGLYKHSSIQPKYLSLPELIRNLKSLTSFAYGRGVHLQNWQSFDKHLWQRSYHEHIIRCEKSLNNIRKYIIDNPANWN